MLKLHCQKKILLPLQTLTGRLTSLLNSILLRFFQLKKRGIALIVVSIEKSSADDILITDGWYHLGDDSFSPNSANCSEFHQKASGSFYTKTFNIPAQAMSSKYILIVGSIIGIDSLLAQQMGQNRVKTSYASPPEIFFNGIKIANIELNGDGQRFALPPNLVRKGMENEITIKTGKNMSQTSRIDYDDIEFMNLSIISEK